MSAQYSIQQISRRLKDCHIEHSLVIHQPDIPVTSYCKITNYLPHSLVYYTENDIDKFPLQQCTLIAPETITPSNKQINYILTENPKVAFYAIAEMFKEPILEQGIHPTAYVDKTAQIGENVTIAPYTVIHKNVIIEDNVIIHPHCVIYPQTIIKKFTEIEAHTIIGATGVFWTWDKHGKMWTMPQCGSVEIGEHCFIGTDVTIVRGSYTNDITRIGRYTKIAHGTKIGHSTQIGNNCHLANNIAIGGGVTLKDRCFIGSGATLKAGVVIQEDVIVGSGAVVVKSFDQSAVALVGNPAKILKLKDRPSGMNEPLWMIKSK